MNSFKEKFKIAKILASLFTHSSTPEEEKNYRAWLDENPEHQKIADRILNKEQPVNKKFLFTKSVGESLSVLRRQSIGYCFFVEKESEICSSHLIVISTCFLLYLSLDIRRND